MRMRSGALQTTNGGFYLYRSGTVLDALCIASPSELVPVQLSRWQEAEAHPFADNRHCGQVWRGKTREFGGGWTGIADEIGV